MIKSLTIFICGLGFVLSSCSKDDPIYRTVPGVFVQEEVSDTLTGFQCFPNPASVQTTISFKLGRQQKLDIQVYNRFGVLVFENADRPYIAGYNHLDIDISGWPQGVYIVQVTVNKKRYSRQLVKA